MAGITRIRLGAYLAWFCFAVPSVSHANVGVPMIFVALPAMAVSLVPIVLLEAWLAMRYTKCSFRELCKPFAVANVVSTFVGIPITWILLVILQIVTGGSTAYGLDSPLSRFLAVTWQAPWLIPYEGDLSWMIPAAALVLLIPFYFVSWWVEYLVAKRHLLNIENALLRRTIRNVNFVSYSLLALYAVIMAIIG